MVVDKMVGVKLWVF